MKKILFPFAVMAIATSANAANIQQYASVKGNVLMGQKLAFDFANSSEKMSANESFGGSIAYGVKLSDFRGELEFNLYSAGKIPENDTYWEMQASHKVLFLNGYYDLKTNSPITPYIGAGIGYNYMTFKVDHTGFDESDSTLAVNIGLGAAVEINKTLSLDIGYRYNYFGEFSADNGVETITATGHQISLGMRASF